jgi:hypothetical protein
MARKVTSVAKMPNAECRACHGFGSVHMTAHFTAGPLEFELPCWMCFDGVKVQLPSPPAIEN